MRTRSKNVVPFKAPAVRSSTNKQQVSRQTRALELCLHALLRMIPEACADGGFEDIDDDEHNAVIGTAAIALYGRDREAWPLAVRKAAEGRYA